MPTSLGHDLTRGDPADLPRCPMERLADVLKSTKKPGFVRAGATRESDGTCFLSLIADVTDLEQLEDIINFLAVVKERAK